MARLPIPRKKQPSKSQQAIETATNLARIYVIVKGTSAASKAAKGGAKAYGTAKGAKVAGRSVVKILAIPAAAVGGVVVWRKVRGGGDGAEPERPLGPVATPESVSPPTGKSASTTSVEDTATDTAEGAPVEEIGADATLGDAPAEAAAAPTVPDATNGAGPESPSATTVDPDADKGTTP
jgi:hypothetical protein